MVDLDARPCDSNTSIRNDAEYRACKLKAVASTVGGWCGNLSERDRRRTDCRSRRVAVKPDCILIRCPVRTDRNESALKFSRRVHIDVSGKNVWVSSIASLRNGVKTVICASGLIFYKNDIIGDDSISVDCKRSIRICSERCANPRGAVRICV